VSHIVIYLLYHLGSHWIWPGQSLGKKIFRLKVVRCTLDRGGGAGSSSEGDGGGGGGAAAGAEIGVADASLFRVAVRCLLFAQRVWSSIGMNTTPLGTRFLFFDIAVKKLSFVANLLFLFPS
jgi:hypothetical protein